MGTSRGRWPLRVGVALAAVMLVVGALQLWSGAISQARTPPGQDGILGNPTPVPAGKVGICHATGSETNPFVFIIVDESAVDESAVEAHRQHQEGRDIVGVGSAADCPQGPAPAGTPTGVAGAAATVTPAPATATPVQGRRCRPSKPRWFRLLLPKLQ